MKLIGRKKGALASILIGMMILGLLLPGGGAVAAENGNNAAAVSQFSDVDSQNSNLVYINYMSARGIISGFPDGSYQPEAGLTRAQAAVIISKAANLNLSSQEDSGFKDVASDYWAANYIAAAVKAGYLKGFNDGSYQPDQPLTRAQAISLIMRLSRQGDSGAALPTLSDMNESHWAARALAMAIDAGMISPQGNSIQPDQSITRGDISRALAILLTSDPQLSSRKLYSTMAVKKGTVKLAHGSGEAQLITNSAPIGAGDTVVTGKDGEAVINYPDGSSLLLKRNSTLTIKESLGRAYIKQDGQPGTAVDDLQVELKVGVMFGGLSSLAGPEADETGPTGMKKNTRRLAAATSRYDLLAAGETPWYRTAEKKKVKVKVDMPWGVAAIRGSFWSNTVNSDGSGSANLLEGSASVSSGGQSVDLSPGQGTESSGGGAPPSPPAPMSPQQQSEWSQQQSWVQSTFNNMSQNQGAPMGGTPAGTGTPSASGNPAAALSQTLNQALSQAQQAAASSPPSSSGSSGGSSPSDGTITISDMPSIILVSYVINPNDGEIQGSASRCFSVNRADAAITWTPATPAKVEIAVSASGTSRCISLTALAPGAETITFTVTAPGCTPLTKTITVNVLPLFKTTPNYKMAGYSDPVNVEIYNTGDALWSTESSGLAVQIIDSCTGQPVSVGGSALPPFAVIPTDSHETSLYLPAGLGVGQYEMLVYNGANPVGMGMFRVGITPATLLPPVFGASVDEPFRMPLIDVDPDWLMCIQEYSAYTHVKMDNNDNELDSSGWDIIEEDGQAFLQIDPAEIEALNTDPGLHIFSIEFIRAGSPSYAKVSIANVFVSAGRPAGGGYAWDSFGAPVLTISLLDKYGNPPAGPCIIHCTVTVTNDDPNNDEVYTIDGQQLFDGETLQLQYDANAASTAFTVQVPATEDIDSGDGFSVLFWIDCDGYPGYNAEYGDFTIDSTGDVPFLYPNY